MTKYKLYGACRTVLSEHETATEAIGAYYRLSWYERNAPHPHAAYIADAYGEPIKMWPWYDAECAT